MRRGLGTPTCKNQSCIKSYNEQFYIFNPILHLLSNYSYYHNNTTMCVTCVYFVLYNLTFHIIMTVWQCMQFQLASEKSKIVENCIMNKSRTTIPGTFLPITPSPYTFVDLLYRLGARRRVTLANRIVRWYSRWYVGFLVCEWYAWQRWRPRTSGSNARAGDTPIVSVPFYANSDVAVLLVLNGRLYEALRQWWRFAAKVQ